VDQPACWTLSLILLSGSRSDPNITHLAFRLAEKGVPWHPCEPGVTHVAWDIQTGTLHLNGSPLSPSAVFGRRNVFQGGGHCADGYHSAVQAWAEATGTPFWPSVPRSPCKVRNLLAAKDCGLRVPSTAICTEAIAGGVAKPVQGGDYTKSLRGGSSMPWGIGFTQQYLKGPEYRVFFVGGEFISFRVASDSLDYRTDPETSFVVADVGSDILQGIGKLARKLGYNFCAADIRCDDSSPVFLEINSSPMFSVADSVCGGKITDALITGLLAAAVSTPVQSGATQP